MVEEEEVRYPLQPSSAAVARTFRLLKSWLSVMVSVQKYGQKIEDNVTAYYGNAAPTSADNNPFVSRTITAPVQYNQVVFYDMRRLHSIVVDEGAETRLSPDPTEGRLTLNMFWWQKPYSKSDRYKHLSALCADVSCCIHLAHCCPLHCRDCSSYVSCEGCSGTPFCSWCAKVGECVENSEDACRGAQHRAGYQGMKL